MLTLLSFFPQEPVPVFMLSSCVPLLFFRVPCDFRRNTLKIPPVNHSSVPTWNPAANPGRTYSCILLLETLSGLLTMEQDQT
ncbi:hypothetical protein CHARACLAT_014043 [Characodon lateralis]|uniref:Uncharacterized protein n=1 Tax=Characodon lateralis TaxID=208331 RepID=A0ABU7F3W3_9TELE|nr:hypothetical protein [Characodon lateralis]